jgi:hypothetical protein
VPEMKTCSAGYAIAPARRPAGGDRVVAQAELSRIIGRSSRAGAYFQNARMLVLAGPQEKPPRLVDRGQGAVIDKAARRSQAEFIGVGVRKIDLETQRRVELGKLTARASVPTRIARACPNLTPLRTRAFFRWQVTAR